VVGHYQKIRRVLDYEGLSKASPLVLPSAINTRRPSTWRRPSAKSCTARG